MITINYDYQLLKLKWSNLDELIKFTDYQSFPINIIKDEPFLKKLQESLFLKNIGNSMQAFCELTFPPLRNKNIRKAISVGAGVGTFELLLSQYLTNSEIFLLDKSEFTAAFPLSNERYCSNDHGFYNSWDVTLDAIHSSDLDINRFKFLEPTDEWPSNVDLVLAKGGWCWCFPKETYWDKLMTSLTIGGTLMLEIPNFNLNYVDEISDQLNCKPTVIQKYHIKGYPFPNHLNFQSVDKDGFYAAYYMWTRNK